MNTIYQRISLGKMTTRDFFKLGIGGLASLVLTGCEDDDEENKGTNTTSNVSSTNPNSNPGTTPVNNPSYAPVNVPFSIDYPSSGEQVANHTITLRGSGIKSEVGSFMVSVYTNASYLQVGNFNLGAGGNWTYAPCYLRGTAPNNHKITATVDYLNGRREVATVENVVRTGPAS